MPREQSRVVRGSGVRGRKRKVKKGRLFLLFLVFILMPTLTVMGVMHLVSDNGYNGYNGVESEDVIAAAPQGNTFLGGLLGGNSVENDGVDEVAKIISGLEEYEIVFTYETYSLVHSFVDFLDYVCEDELVPNFDVNKVRKALIYMNDRIHSSENIDKDLAIYDAMSILMGTMDTNVVMLTMEWTRNPNLLSKDLLGTFYTYFNPGEVGRNGNIRRAADLINDLTLLPGQDFSMNRAIGPVVLDNGYYVALVIANGEFVEGIGGGVCQVASTLYMALLHAELEILQRRAHSRMVGYVPPAFDAVLATPYLDLRFRNDTNAPITIETQFDYRSHRITVSIWGQDTRSESRTISFESVHAAENDRYVSYHLYKLVNDNGNRSRIRINISTYRAEQEGVITYYEAVGGTLDDDD